MTTPTLYTLSSAPINSDSDPRILTIHATEAGAMSEAEEIEDQRLLWSWSEDGKTAFAEGNGEEYSVTIATINA